MQLIHTVSGIMKNLFSVMTLTGDIFSTPQFNRKNISVFGIIIIKLMLRFDHFFLHIDKK